MDLYFYFMSNPRLGPRDFHGALEQEKLIYGSDITIVDSAQDLVEYVAPWVRWRGGRIKRMKISAHGGFGAFHLGEDDIEMKEHGPTHGLIVLGLLAPWFAPGAEVEISACQCAQPKGTYKDELLPKLASMWPGVSVKGYTGYAWTWKWWKFHGSGHGGDRIVCTGNQCLTNPPEHDPRWHR